MTILEDTLAFLQGWTYDIVQPAQNYVIQPGMFRTTFDSAQKKKPCSGWVLGISACADNPLAQIEVIHYGPQWQERRIVGSPFALNGLGLAQWNGSGFYYGTYSAVLGQYCAFYHPDSKPGHWDQQLRIRLINPTAAVLNIQYYTHTLIVVTDEVEWRKSLLELLHGEK